MSRLIKIPIWQREMATSTTRRATDFWDVGDRPLLENGRLIHVPPVSCNEFCFLPINAVAVGPVDSVLHRHRNHRRSTAVHGGPFV